MHEKAYQCYQWNKIYIEKKAFEKHLTSFSGIPGVSYVFDSQNMLTFE